MNILYLFLGLLKIIGLLLLVLLAALLFMLILALAVPVRYDVRGERQEALEASIAVTWLFRLIYFQLWIRQDTEAVVRLRLFGFSVLGGEKKKRKKKARRRRRRKQEEPVLTAMEKPSEPKREPEPALTPPPEKPTATTVLPEKKKPEEIYRTIHEEPPVTDEEKPAAEEEPIQPRVRRVKMTEVEEIPFSPEKEENIEPDNASEKTEEPEGINVAYFKKMSWEEKKALFRIGKRYVKKLFKNVFPRSLRIRGRIGAGDPALTGYVMAAGGMINGIYRDSVRLIPCFEQVCVEGSIAVAGRVSLGCAAAATIQLLLTKPVRKMIKVYRKGKVRRNGE